MYIPDEKTFLKLTQKGNLIPVYCEIMGDLDTPVSAYFKIASQTRYAFLLESVEGEEKVARYSFLAKDPELLLRSRGSLAEIHRLHNGQIFQEKKSVTSTPLEFIREIMASYRFVPVPGLPRFCGGLIGYLSYDIVRFFERLPERTVDDLHLPDMLMVLAKKLIIFDHLNHNMKIVNCVHVDPQSSKGTQRKAYRRAIQELKGLIQELNQPLPGKKDRLYFHAENSKSLQPRSNLSEERFKQIVKKAKKDIRAGEIIQVVLSQRFVVPVKTDPFNIYRALRSLNPSPYMYYLHWGKFQIIGSSPELLVRCENGLVETRPIAGTRPRGKDEKEDEQLKQDLLNDPKEKAEHIMLVDLGRNDLGRVCRQGTVRVSEFMAIEKYSHVMHIVSNVTGQLKPGLDALDALQAAFPAGTVSGAPKIRAMEIIEELEEVARGPYAGCVGYISFSGNLDTCITIRTIVVKDEKAYIQAGAGIVADSKPAQEYRETVNKAKAQIMAVALAHQS